MTKVVEVREKYHSGGIYHEHLQFSNPPVKNKALNSNTKKLK